MIIRITHRDIALHQLGEADLGSQLFAIKGVLRRNQEDATAAKADIDALADEIHDTPNQDPGILLADLFDHLHCSVFLNAAHSMAAVGMLAPFVESLFVWIFRVTRANRQENREEGNLRKAASQNEFWDPHFVFHRGGRRIDLVEGIKQLAASTGLAELLPEGLENMLSALFAYRNKMFHHGLVWPKEERQKFGNLIQEKGWPSDWFEESSTNANGETWVTFLSISFIEYCLTTIDEVLEGVGVYFQQHEQLRRIQTADRST